MGCLQSKEDSEDHQHDWGAQDVDKSGGGKFTFRPILCQAAYASCPSQTADEYPR